MLTTELVALAERHTSDMATQRKLGLELRALEDAEVERRKKYEADLRSKKNALHIAQARSQESGEAIHRILAEVPKEVRDEVERAEIEARAIADKLKEARISFHASAFDRDWLRKQPGVDKASLREADRLVAEHELAVLEIEERESRHGIKLSQAKKQAAAAFESLKRDFVRA